MLWNVASVKHQRHAVVGIIHDSSVGDFNLMPQHSRTAWHRGSPIRTTTLPLPPLNSIESLWSCNPNLPGGRVGLKKGGVHQVHLPFKREGQRDALSLVEIEVLNS